MRIDGARRLARKLAAMPKQARGEISAAIAKSADEVVALQKAAVPIDDGTLRNSIRWGWGGAGIARQLKGDAGLAATITAGGAATTRPVRQGADASYDYALAQEFGTRKMAANPFFFPAYRLVRKRVRSRISRATNSAAKKVAAGGR